MIRAAHAAALQRIRALMRRDGNHTVDGLHAEDIAQDTIAAMLLNNTPLQFARRKAEYVYTDALRRHLGRQRKRALPTTHNGDALRMISAPAASDVHKVEQECLRMIDKVDCVPWVREAWALRVLGLSYKAVGKRVGYTDTHVRNTLRANAAHLLAEAHVAFDEHPVCD